MNQESHYAKLVMITILYTWAKNSRPVLLIHSKQTEDILLKKEANSMSALIGDHAVERKVLANRI